MTSKFAGNLRVNDLICVALSFQLSVLPIYYTSAVHAAPAVQQDAAGGESDQGKSLSDMIADRNREQTEKAKNVKKTGGILGAIGGIGTFFLCGGGKKGASDTTKLLCTAAGAAVAYTAVLISNSIAKKLVEKDQKKVLAAAGQSLRTGEPQQLTLPDSSASASVAGSGQPVFREATVNIFYDTVRVADLSKIKVIAEPYVVTKANTLVRNLPSTTGKVSGKLAANTPLYVSGQVDNSNWYLVSERVVEGEESAMMAVGYVDSKLLKPAAASAVLPGKAPPPTIARKDVLAVLKCDKIGFAVRDAKGKQTNSTSELCLGPEGTPISA